MTTDQSREHEHDLLEGERTMLAFDAPASRERGMGIGRRLVVGFVLCCLIAAGCWVVLPRFGVWVPVWVPLACFAIIAGAAVFARNEGDVSHDEEDGPGGGCCGGDDGRPICCSGPRPMKMFKD